MNYYEHHIGDYAEATAHLTFIEDGAYSRLIRKCYATERLLPADLKEVQRLAGCRTTQERQAVERVLKEFFVLQDDGWHQHRCDEEIERYQAKSRSAKANALARWSRSERNATASSPHMRNGCDGNATASDSHDIRNALQSPDSSPQSPDTNPRKDPTARRKSPRPESAPEFLEFKAAYPKRAGDQGWSKALRAAHARIAEGHSWPEMVAGATRYSAFVRSSGKEGSEYVKQASTFLGPDKPFLEPWDTPPASSKAGTNGATDHAALEAWQALLAGKERDQRTQDALDAIGGWGRVLHRTAFDDAKVRSEFCNAWRTAA
ncbi:MAG: YdaU family protein [Steroidobacteraceae bacterium]